MTAFISPSETKPLFDTQASLWVGAREFRFLSGIAERRVGCTRCEITVSDGESRLWEIILLLHDEPCTCDETTERRVRELVADWLLQNQQIRRATSWDYPVEIEWPPPQIYRGPI